jgi:hypothetical protein
MSQSLQPFATRRVLASALFLTLCAAALLLAKGALFGAASAAKPVAGTAAVLPTVLMDCVAPPQPDKLIGWWPLDEGIGGTVVKDIMLGHNGTPKPAGVLNNVPMGTGPEPRAGMVNGAHYFFGRQIYTQVPHNGLFNISNGSFTIDAWVNPVQVGTTQLQPIVDKFNLTSPTTGTGFAFYIRNRQLVLDLGSGTGLFTFSTSQVINFNTWQHVAVVADRTNNTVRFYHNGVLAAGGGNLTANYQNNVLDLLIGGTRSGLPYGELALDELEIFNTALTQPELFSLFNAMGAGKCKPTCPPQGCATTTFALAASYVSGTQPLRLATADFDNDGDLDLAVPNTGNNNISSLLNNGAGVFSQAPNSPIATAAAPLAVAVGDFNNDGNSDLAAASQQPTAQITLLRGLGNGQFQSFGAPLTNAGPDPVFPAVADFNKDGKQDLAVANLGSGNVYVLQGNGTGGFTPFGAPISAGGQTIALTVGDFNNDGNPDLATANGGSNNVAVLLGNGIGSFSAAPPLAVGTSPSCVVTADFNKDGKPDLAVSNRTNGNVTVLRGNGDGSFTSFGNFSSGSLPLTLTVGDFNCDGNPDIAAAQLGSALAVLLGNGSGAFAAPALFGTPYYGIVAGDFNDDGSPDLAASNSNGNNVAVFLNTCVRKRASTITINPAPLPNPIIGAPYNQTITASGGTAPYTYTISGGTLKPGFTLNPTTGVLSGTPTTSGTFTFTVTVTDANGCQASIEYTITCCPLINLAPTSLPDGIAGVPYSQAITATGGASPYMYTATGLPNGLSLSMNSGLLSGTTAQTGSFTVVVTAKDANGCTGTRSYTVVIRPCSLRVLKSIASTSVSDTADPNVTIGETVVFRLRIELPDGVVPSLTVKDVIPPGMSVTNVNGRVTDGGSIPLASIPVPVITPTSVPCPNVGGAPVTLTYGAINVPVDTNPNNNYFYIHITAQVCDSPANMGMFVNNQTMLTNRAMAAIGPQPSLCMANSNELTLKVVEPKLRITKSFSPATVIEGSLTNITLAVSNVGLSTAYSVVLEDLLPTAIFDHATMTTCATPPSGFTFSKPIVGANTAATFTGGNINVGQTLTFCIKVTVKQRCRMDMFNNIATIKHAFTLPPPTCVPDCTRPDGTNELQGREEGGAQAAAKLTIQPGPHCTCFGEVLPNGFKRPPAYTSMVEWLKFDETIGDEAGDASAANNDGTLLPASPNGPTHTTGLVQNALLFDGANDYVLVNDNSSLNLGTNSFTIDAWINPAASSLNGLHSIVDKRSFAPGSGSNAPGYKFFLFDGRLALQINDGNFFNFIAPVATNLSAYANQWVHVAVTCERTATSNTARFYVDGGLIHTQATAQVPGSLNNPSPLYVGRGVPHDADFFKGKIDELEIFNSALTNATIAGIANAGKFGKCLPTPPYECCGKKPVFPDVPGAPEATYSTFTGQVAAVTCYALNPNDPAIAVIDLKNQAGAPLDSNWFPGLPSNPPTAFYHHPSWSQTNLGDVFGLTLDGNGNVFVAAGSVYRRQGPGVFPTQLSHKAAAGPGGIYRLAVGTGTGAATPQVFVGTVDATTYISGNLLPNKDPLGVGGTTTEAPGLGNLTFDCQTNMFYVTNFEDGLIYRINAAGTILDQWNHGANISPQILDNAQVGLTQLGRRVWAVKTYNNRLYYSVWRNDRKANNGLRNEIWSVGLNDTTGAFVGPQQLEISLPVYVEQGVPQNWSSPVSDISFMNNGTMLLAERTMETPQTVGFSNPFVSAHVSRALEYIFTGVLWQPTSKTLEVGRGPAFPLRAGTNTSGGIDIDRQPAGGRIWATGDALHFASGDYIYGLQGMPAAGTSGLLTANSVLIDLDGNVTGGGKFQIGDVQIPCFSCADVAINISPDMLPSGVAGQNYTSPTLTASGGTPGYTFTATGLPMGLALNNNQVIVGVPMQTGTFDVTVTVTDANGCSSSQFYQLIIECAVISIGPASLPDGMVGMAYSSTFTAAGGCGDYVFSQVGGTLPPGLTLAANGTFTGTPTACGTYVFTIKASDKCGCMATQTYSLTLSGQQQPITGLFNTGVDNNNGVLAIGAQDTHYALTLPDNSTGNASVITPNGAWLPNNASPLSMWVGPSTAQSNSTYVYTTTFMLPNCPGLTAAITGRWAVDNAATITLNGNVVESLTDPGALTNFTQFNPLNITSGFQPGLNTLTVTVSNGISSTGLRIEWAGIYKCCPCQLVLGPNNLDVGTVNTPYGDQVEPIGGTAPYTYTTAGNLPPGVSFTNGVFTGTPTVSGTYSYTVTVTDANGCTATRTFTLTIACQAVDFDPPFLSAGFVGSAYNRVLALAGSVGPVTWSRVSGTLPPGVTLATNGTLAGTPTTTGVFNFRVSAIDASTCVALKDYTLEVTCPRISVFPPSSIPAARVGQIFSTTFTASGGAAPYTFTRVSGLLPPGLTLASTGVLAGAPTTAGTFAFTLQAANGNGCAGTLQFSLTVCADIVVSPTTLPLARVGQIFNQVFTQTGAVGTALWRVGPGSLPPGLSLNEFNDTLAGTPTQAGSFNFTVSVADENGCPGSRAYTLTVVNSGNGLQFYPLPTPVRALETRPGFNGCSTPGTPINANTSFTLAVRTGCTGIPANATAVTGNVTVVPGATGGYLTLFPSSTTQPIVANSNFKPFEVTNNVFTTGLGAGDGAFKIFASATTEVIVDITGYYAPPGANGLYFHPLPEPVRLVETRTLPGLTGCIKPGAPLTGGQDFAVQGRSPVAAPCNVIPAAAQVLVGNATSVFPATAGFLTLFPSDAVRPLIASSNYAGADIINGPFAVKLGADGKFKVYTHATTELVIDILGYYSTEASDANGAGLLFNPLDKPVRLLETRPDPGFPLTGCYRPDAKIIGGTSGIRTQQSWGTCEGLTIPTTARAIIGNATVVNVEGAGFMTFYPGNVATAPTVATSNYPFPVVFGYNRHFSVGVSPTDGTFKILTQATTDLIVDVAGYFAP